ncbi:MAG: hypothetical protein ACE5EZ_01035 [Thermodesulfobacteriota bacterium]
MKKRYSLNLILLVLIIFLCSLFTGRASVAGMDSQLPALAGGEINPLTQKVKTNKPSEAQKAEVKNAYGNLPLYFIENKGAGRRGR